MSVRIAAAMKNSPRTAKKRRICVAPPLTVLQGDQLVQPVPGKCQLPEDLGPLPEDLGPLILQCQSQMSQAPLLWLLQLL